MFSLIRFSRQNIELLYKTRIISTYVPLFSNFTGRDIQDFSHGESGTLTQRFIKYIALESCKFDPLTPQKIKYSQYYPVHDFRDFRKLLLKTDINQLPRLIVYTYTYKTNGEPERTAQIINEIDALCCQRLNEIDTDEILRILYTFMYLIPNKVPQLDFYRNSMEKMVENFDKTILKEQFVQICYYLGLAKKNYKIAKYMEEFLQIGLIHYLNNLNRIDFAIVANAAFKTGIPLSNEDFQKRLIDEILSSDIEDDAILVTLIKSLRLNRIKSEEIIQKLKSILMDSKNVEKLHFKGLVHIFAYFAECFWNEPEICQILLTACKDRLESVSNSEKQPFNDMRAKDLSTFVWSCAHLNITELTNDDYEFIEEIILNKCNRNEFKYATDELIDTCLSLWMLNFKSKDLISHAERISLNTHKPQSPDRIKLDSRIKLLMNCVQLEKPDWLTRKLGKVKVFDEKRKAPEYLVKNRKYLNHFNELLIENKEEFAIKSVNITAPILELNVAGIFIEFGDGRKCFLEVLEKNQILKFNQLPISIVSLKIKILENLGYHVLMIDDSECTLSDDLKTTLKTKLDTVPVCLDVKKIAL